MVCGPLALHHRKVQRVHTGRSTTVYWKPITDRPLSPIAVTETTRKTIFRQAANGQKRSFEYIVIRYALLARRDKEEEGCYPSRRECFALLLPNQNGIRLSHYWQITPWYSR